MTRIVHIAGRKQVATGASPRVFGDDRPTPVGICVRDDVHVADIAFAQAARRVTRGPSAQPVLNVGRGECAPVAEMTDIIPDVTGLLPVTGARRLGDSARMIGSAGGIGKELDRSARHGVRAVIESAWAGWWPPAPQACPDVTHRRPADPVTKRHGERPRYSAEQE